MFITGVHPLDDQSVALRLVSLTDRLYDAGIPVVASGAKLDTIFSEEMLAGGFRKKYLRATSRLLALTAAGVAGLERPHHHVVVLDVAAEPERLGAADGEAVLGVEALRALVFLIDAEPDARRAERRGPRSSAAAISAAETPAPWASGSTYILDSSTAGRSGTARCDVGVVGHAANQHGVAQDSAVVARDQHHPVRVGEVVGEARRRQVLGDEGGDVVRRRPRRAGQREGPGGDVGEFGQVGRRRPALTSTGMPGSARGSTAPGGCPSPCRAARRW